MSIQSDHKALLFVGAIAILGAGVRIARANGVKSAVVAQPALDHQMQAADSSKQATVAKRQSKKKKAAASASAPNPGQPPQASQSAQPNGRGHINGRLDLDVATAAQIDSLPGVGPSLAKRIAADRMARGPFLKLTGLKRVKGASAKVLERLDSLVTFSGTIASGSATDTIIPAKAKPSQRGGASSPPPDLLRE